MSEQEKQKVELRRICLDMAIAVCKNRSLESAVVTVGETKSENVLEVAKKFEEYITSVS